MNRWNSTAYLTRDPERAETHGETTICVLRVGVKRAGRDGKDGYFTVKCFNGHAHACLEHLKAGRQVAIEGRLQHEQFETPDGERREKVVIIASWVEFLPSGGRRDGTTGDDEKPSEEPTAVGAGTGDGDGDVAS